MRYSDFRIVETKLQEANEVYVIGDSHARAMGGENNLAVNGARLSAIAAQADRVPNGSIVYMTGGHNDVAGGGQPQAIASQVSSIINSLTNKDCDVTYILFPEGTDNNNQENMASTRQAIASAVPVGEDLDGCNMQADGIHCQLGRYRGIVNNSAESSENANDGLEKGPPYPQEQRDQVRQVQAKLEELLYSVGNTGVDGKYGPRTARAIAAYRRDRNLPDSNRGASISAEEIEQLMGAERTEEITATGNRYEFNPQTGERERSNAAAGDPNAPIPGYPEDVTRRSMEEIIRREAEIRGIEPDVAVRIFRAEGASAYQSQIPRSGRGSHGGREASFGPFQLYIGGGLGNTYQDETGRNLLTDNTPEGIENQIRFALDMAIADSWEPWLGRIPAGVGRRQGLDGAEQARNWS